MIYIGFGTNDKWYSKLIRWATKSQWSHAWIEYWSETLGGYWVIHARPEGVIIVPSERVVEMYPRRKYYECKIELRNAKLWISEYVGAKYDYGVIWNGLLLVLLRLTGGKWLWNIVARNASKMSCSEFACGLLKDAKVVGTENMDPELTTPGDLEEFCSGSEDFCNVRTCL